jgi:PII-like signaling protein
MIIHNRSSWWIVDRTPAILYVVDTPERIEAFLPMLADVADQCLISVDDVNVVEFS